MALLKREFGGIQPCWKVGLFRIRLPFIHFRISPPEIVTGLMNACTSYGALAVLITTLGLDPQVACAYGPAADKFCDVTVTASVSSLGING